MNALILTNRPDRFLRLEQELLRHGHHVVVLAGKARLEREHSPDPVGPDPLRGTGRVAAGIDLAICDLAGSPDPGEAWMGLRDFPGRPSFTVAAMENVDPDRADAAFDAGFDDVVFGACEPERTAIRRWEKAIARVTVLGDPAAISGSMAEPVPARPVPALEPDMAGEAGERARDPRRARLPDEGALFRAALKDTNVFVVSVDRDLRLIWIGNPRPGFFAEEILGKRPSELEQVEDVGESEAVLREALASGQPILREVRSRIQERSRRQLVHAVPRQGPGGETVALDIASIDITELREAQEALERTQAHYKLLEELSPDLIWSYRSPEDLDYINPRWEETLGRGIEDLHVGRWDRFIHPDDLPRLREVWARAWGDGHPFSYELRLKVRDGSYRWFWARSVAKLDKQGHVVKVVGVTSDIEERKRNEISLRESEARFRDLANNMTQMAWMNDPEGTSFWTNRTWIEYTGMSIDEIKAKGWGTVNHPDHVDRVVGGFYEALRKGEPWEDTFPLRGKDGRYRWFLTRVVPIRDEAGRIVRWLGTNTDVTEQREAMEAAERSRAQLEAVLQSVQDGITVADMQGRIVFLNKVHGWVRDLDRTENAQHPFTHYRDALELEEMDGTPVALEDWPIARIIRGDTISEWLLKRRNKRTGEERYLMYTGQLARNESGEPVLAVLVTRDVTAQRQAEETLRETNALLQAIRESSTNMIYAKDQQGRLLAANPATLQALGKIEEEVIGKTDMDFLPDAESARMVMEHDRRIMESRRSEVFEETVRYPDGSVRTWLSTKTPHRDAHGNVIGMLGISHEITERKQIEDAVRRERELLSRLIDRLPVMISIFDARDGSFRLNEEFRRTLGWNEEDATRDDLFVLAFPDPEIREHVRNLMATSAPGWHDFTATCKDNLEIPSSWAYLMTDGIRVGIGIDLRDRKRAEQELRDAQKLLQSLMDNSPSVMAFKDAEGRYIDVNRTFERTFGLTKEQVRGRADHELFPPGQADEFRTHDLKVLGSRQPNQVEVFTDLPQGAYHHLDARYPLIDSKGRLYGLGLVSHNITERKQAEEALQRLNGDLEALVRERTSELEAKASQLERSNADLQRFAYIASHDLQEPLRIVVSYAQLLVRRYEGRLDESADEYIDFMAAAAKRMGDLIDDLLVYSRVESVMPNLQRVEMSQCVRNAIARRQDNIRSSGAEIAVGPLPALEADESLLCRLLDQLLGNALKFHSEKPPRIAISATQEGDQWIISVRDNGIGIPQEFQAAIFEPFRRLHHWDEYPGTGIGLAVCRRIVESHGGRIWVESAEDGGAIFRFALPVIAAQGEARTGEGSAEEQTREQHGEQEGERDSVHEGA